jgi:hypothetical protein
MLVPVMGEAVLDSRIGQAIMVPASINVGARAMPAGRIHPR